MTARWLFLASLTVSACGSNDGASPDAPHGGDAPQGGDAASPDAPANSATVVVTRTDAPVPGVTVAFHDAAGAVLGTAMTGADGKANGPIVDGGQVTVAFGDAGSRRLLTYLGVKTGDVLQVVEPVDRLVQITIPSGNPGGGISVTAGNFNCSTNASSSGSVQVALAPECISGATFPVLAMLYFGGDQYFSFKRDVAPAASGTTMVSGLSAWDIGTSFPVTVGNAPNLSGPLLYLAPIANDQAIGLTPLSPFTINAGVGSAMFDVPSGYADAYEGELQFRSQVGSFTQLVTYAQRVPSTATSQVLDLGGGLLPGLTDASATNTEPARPAITWTASASLADTDGGVAQLRWHDGSEDLAWTFIVPPGTMSVTAPALPAAMTAWAPTATSSLYTPAVAFAESDLLPGYDAVRAQAGRFGLQQVPLGEYNDVLVPALPADGTIRITALTPE